MRQSRGFTLLEILVVLALLVIVSAMAWPSFEAWFQSHRLREGVDAIRTHWVKARTRAMEEGRPYRFAWMPETGSYRLAPHDLEHWEDSAEVASAAPFAGTGFSVGLVVEEELPEGVRFTDGAVRAKGDASWSRETILFWPDGTAKIIDADGAERPDTQVLVCDRRGRCTAIQLRGLTGVVTVFNFDQ